MESKPKLADVRRMTILEFARELAVDAENYGSSRIASNLSRLVTYIEAAERLREAARQAETSDSWRIELRQRLADLDKVDPR